MSEQKKVAASIHSPNMEAGKTSFWKRRFPVENHDFQVPFVKISGVVPFLSRSKDQKSQKNHQVGGDKRPDETPGRILFDLCGLCDLLVCALLLLGRLCKFGALQYLSSKWQGAGIVSP